MSANLIAISGYERQLRQGRQMLDQVGGPKGLIGRICGLGEAEMRAGVPGWAWLGVGALAGAALAYHYRDKLSRVFDDDE